MLMVCLLSRWCLPCPLMRGLILQWEDFGEDRCNENLIKDNSITTNGNECVETKEGASDNVIEHNTCSDQNDSESGCFASRGDANTIRYTTSVENVMIFTLQPTVITRSVANTRIDIDEQELWRQAWFSLAECLLSHPPVEGLSYWSVVHLGVWSRVYFVLRGYTMASVTIWT